MLAVCVLIFHCPPGLLPRFLHSGLAIQCFYIISGFLVQLVITNYRRKGEKRWVLNFYQSRLLRLLPLYWLVTLITMVFFGSSFIVFWRYQDFGALAIFAFNNLFIFGQDVLRLFLYDLEARHFLPIPPHVSNTLALTGNGVIPTGSFTVLWQSWSLAIELLFYAVAPFLLLRRWWVLCIFAMLSIASRAWFANIGYIYNSHSNGIIFNELIFFLLGALGCRFWRRWLAEGQFSHMLSRLMPLRLADGLVRAGCLSITVWLLHYYYIGWTAPPFGGKVPAEIIGLPYTWWATLVLTALALPFVFHATGKWKWDRALGDLSYPLYINHVIFILIAWESGLPVEQQGIVILMSSLACAVAMLFLAERPLERLRHRLFLPKQSFHIAS